MLIKINDEQHLNSDYVVALHIKQQEETKNYFVLATMIDGKIATLNSYLTKEDAQGFYDFFVKEANKDRVVDHRPIALTI